MQAFEMNEETISGLFVAALCEDAAGQDTTRLAQLGTEEWNQLLELALQQQVVPLLYHRLKARGWDTLAPAPVLERCRRLYRDNAARNLALHHDLGQILRALQRGGIPVIVLKGAYLAASLYPNPGLRSVGDIDILVPRTQTTAAWETLVELGYYSEEPFTVEESLADTYNYHLPRMVKEGSVAIVELHWGLTPFQNTNSFNLTEDLWARAVPVTLCSSPALSLCREDLLLHLCGHMTHHHMVTLFWQGMRALCDIDLAVRLYQNAIDWEQLQKRAEVWGWSRGVHLSLHLAVEMLQTPVPAEVLRRLQPPGFQVQIGYDARAQLLGSKQDLPHYLARLWSIPFLGDKVRTLVRRVFPSRLEMAELYQIPVNSPRIYLKYLVRIKSLLVRDGRMVWRLWRGHQKETGLVQRTITLTEWLDGTSA